MEVRRLLETQRDENSGDLSQDPNLFAIELAYVIEQYGKDTEEDALTILDLYLKGANSVILATSYAHRNATHTIVLWNTLIQYCLEGIRIDSSIGNDTRSEGVLFGSLLESAALCGADLALLVTRIPQGMMIEGLRPRLVAAVGDYRLKLQMHEATSDIGNREKISLLREWTHRSRRAMRYSRVSGVGTVEWIDPIDICQDQECRIETSWTEHIGTAESVSTVTDYSHEIDDSTLKACCVVHESDFLGCGLV